MAVDYTTQLEEEEADHLLPPAGGAGGAGPSVFNETIFKEMTDYEAAFDYHSPNVIQWAKDKDAATKTGAIKLKANAIKAIGKNMRSFGLIFYCSKHNGNPFIDLTQALEDAFVAYKIGNGFPPDMAWDGAKP